MNDDLTIYVSGLYSGTNPQPGVGIGRSLRAAFPNAKLIGVEYSNRCSGVHWHDFNDIWLQRPWTELNLELHATEIRKRLDEGAYWISSIDLEIMWLGEVFPHGHTNLLVPSSCALRRVAKPAIPAHAGLPLNIPEYVTTTISDWELHAFCRSHDWKVWLKGPYYEAVKTPSWSEFEHWRNVLSTAWATDDLFLQTHVTGYEESIMLSAYRGELLNCVYMRKRDVTELGKTWAGDVKPVEPEIVSSLRKIIRDLEWTGGAELEMVRDAEDQLWLIEWNPRFPAWVHGSTIAGFNLPAALIECASGVRAEVPKKNGSEFTRVVIEIPVLGQFPLSPLPEPLGGAIGHSLKHPSGLIEFAQRLRDDQNDAFNLNGGGKPVAMLEGEVPASYLDDVLDIDFANVKTPSAIFFEKSACQAFQRAGDMVASNSSSIHTFNAYSIKTNPDSRLLQMALNAGFLAEAISPLEARKAVDAGFRTDQVVLNGPAKWWRRESLPAGIYHAVFSDSVNELQNVGHEIESGKFETQIAGIRLRTPNIRSRFGIPIDSPELFEQLISAIRTLPKSVQFGIHFHMASSNIGVRQWMHLFKSMLRWCGSVEALSGRVVECLDIGGGWFPDDLFENGHTLYDDIMQSAIQHLSGLNEIILEPGKALAQPSMALAMSVLEVRRYPGGSSEVVMDGSIAELPMHFFHPHRILHQSENQKWVPMARGKSLLLGRLCMEHDILASHVHVPENTKAGDIFVVCDAGAYDRSMSYVFGCG